MWRSYVKRCCQEGALVALLACRPKRADCYRAVSPGGLHSQPGMEEDLRKPEPYNPQYAALGYFGPQWWFTLHMIQTPMMSLVAVGLWLLADKVASSEGLAATILDRK